MIRSQVLDRLLILSLLVTLGGIPFAILVHMCLGGRGPSCFDYVQKDPMNYTNCFDVDYRVSGSRVCQERCLCKSKMNTIDCLPSYDEYLALPPNPNQFLESILLKTYLLCVLVTVGISIVYIYWWIVVCHPSWKRPPKNPFPSLTYSVVNKYITSIFILFGKC